MVEVLVETLETYRLEVQEASEVYQVSTKLASHLIWSGDYWRARLPDSCITDLLENIVSLVFKQLQQRIYCSYISWYLVPSSINWYNSGKKNAVVGSRQLEVRPYAYTCIYWICLNTDMNTYTYYMLSYIYVDIYICNSVLLWIFIIIFLLILLGLILVQQKSRGCNGEYETDLRNESHKKHLLSLKFAAWVWKTENQNWHSFCLTAWRSEFASPLSVDFQRVMAGQWRLLQQLAQMQMKTLRRCRCREEQTPRISMDGHNEGVCDI